MKSECNSQIKLKLTGFSYIYFLTLQGREKNFEFVRENLCFPLKCQKKGSKDIIYIMHKCLKNAWTYMYSKEIEGEKKVEVR